VVAVGERTGDDRAGGVQIHDLEDLPPRLADAALLRPREDRSGATEPLVLGVVVGAQQSVR